MTRAEGDMDRVGDTSPKSEAEERVRGLMDALEASVAAAKKAAGYVVIDEAWEQSEDGTMTLVECAACAAAGRNPHHTECPF